MTGGQGKRHKHLLDDFKKRREYFKLKGNTTSPSVEISFRKELW